MNITKGEYTQFSLTGRLQLLTLYGELVALVSSPEAEVLIFRLFDFFVALVTDHSRCSTPVAADPVTPGLVKFYSQDGTC